ncbi:MAG: hydrogenase formation protein HypD [Deltaproteobacteria bacterium]|nr:hydrogenase formation protein HypD [Deltaproteobacteria bacterium]
MALKHVEEYRDSEIAKKLIERIHETSTKDFKVMEVCGTHTMSIFKNGIRDVLPDTVSLISGPGCPVCVTAQKDICAFIDIARMEDTIVALFGDLMKVPGGDSTLMLERANGADVRIVYSALDSIKIAQENPDKKVVFLGVGFETTAPTIAASIQAASKMGLKNFFVYTAHKLVPPALEVLMNTEGVKIDGFLLPGHVLLISGTDEYVPFVEKYKIPTVVGGFEPVDILHAMLMMIQQFEEGKGTLENAYQRAVSAEGNVIAKNAMYDVFETSTAIWRGIGPIPESGLSINDKYKEFDASIALGLDVKEVDEPKGCACGAILTGLMSPPDCKLFKKVCTPINPIGPCMVSNEGTCAAFYKYHV